MDGVRPQPVILTLYGDYVRHVGGRIWIGSLIRLMSHLAVSQEAVRSTVSRMKRKGLLQVDRVETRSYYSLTPRTTRILEEGAVRIFQFPFYREPWDGRWHLVTFSIPETERDARDRFRRELEWMGFGMLTNALWISPNDHRRDIDRLADSLGMRTHVEIFTARHDGFSDPRSIITRCWDIPALNARYGAFVEKYKPMCDELGCLLARGEDIAPCDYFVRRFMLIHEFRRFPFMDPELPAELLPPDWHGAEAVSLFRHYHHLLAEKANMFFYSIYDDRSATRRKSEYARTPRKKGEDDVRHL